MQALQSTRPKSVFLSRNFSHTFSREIDSFSTDVLFFHPKNVNASGSPSFPDRLAHTKNHLIEPLIAVMEFVGNKQCEITEFARPFDHELGRTLDRLPSNRLKWLFDPFSHHWARICNKAIHKSYFLRKLIFDYFPLSLRLRRNTTLTTVNNGLIHHLGRGGAYIHAANSLFRQIVQHFARSLFEIVCRFILREHFSGNIEQS